MHKAITHHPLTNAQPVLEQWRLPQSTPFSFMAFFPHDVMCYGISLSQLRSAPLLAGQ